MNINEMMEICDNAIDDDEDGLIDLNDPDCACSISTPKSLIPNPSFEERLCCPRGRSQLDCATGWIQASTPTTDFIHTCDWLGWEEFPPPLPYPDGNGIMGFRDGRVQSGENGVGEKNWKEYAGACLLSPLIANITYRFEFYVGFTPNSSPEIEITFFGTPDCQYLPFGGGDSGFGCPTNGDNWIQLGARRVSGFGSWIKTSIEVTPEVNINAIAIGPSCRATFATESTYYFFDNLILADLKAFEFKITEVNHPCDELFNLVMPDDPQFDYQWYKDGIALIGERSPALSRIHGEGAYQVKFESEDFCGLTEVYPHYIPFSTKNEKKGICAQQSYAFADKNLTVPGIYYDTLLTVNNCDSIIILELSVQSETPDTIQAKIFEGEKYREIKGHHYTKEGDHLAAITTDIGCDSLIFLQLEYYEVYIPNIFSPNGDGVNDRFTIQGGSDLLEIEELSIFDRWGNQIYTSTKEFENDGNGWDGFYNGSSVQAGLYVYHCVLTMDDNKPHPMSGTVLVSK